jgi:hypothetical protein
MKRRRMNCETKGTCCAFWTVMSRPCLQGLK